MASPRGLLKILDPTTAHIKVKAALRTSHGNVEIAAAELGINRRTLFRWIEAHPELAAEVKRLRKEAEKMAHE